MEQLLLELSQRWEAFASIFAFDSARLSEPGMAFRLSLQVFLLGCSAFFSSSETALFSLSRLDLQQLRRERNPRSETLHALLDQPRRLIISILCGNELVNIAAAANMTGILVTLYGGDRAGWINLLVMVPLLLLFGEVTPKTIAVANPVRFSTGIVAKPLSIWVVLVTPLRMAIRGISDRITTLVVGESKSAENILQIDEFLSLVEEVTKEGELDATERALIYNLLEANDTEIVEIMTPRTRVEFLNVSMSVPEMVERFREIEHPRVPVFRNRRDNVVGFLHAEDILRLILDDADLKKLKPKDIMHPPVVAPLTKKVDEMFDFFQLNNARAAVCLNEFGGVEGFLTLRDVLNFIFGQISGKVRGDELYKERDENSYEVPGDMKLNDFDNLTNFGIEDPRMTTIGGVALRHLDRLPKVGDRVLLEGIMITVLEMDAHRIARVLVAPKGKPEELDEIDRESLVIVESAEPDGAGARDDTVAEHKASVETVDEAPAQTVGPEPAAPEQKSEKATDGKPPEKPKARESVETVSRPEGDGAPDDSERNSAG